MKTAALQELHTLESTYWWHVGRLSIIEHQLQKICGIKRNVKILNVGSGTGGTLPVLEKFGRIQNVDTSKEALAFLNASGYKGKLVKGLKLPFKDGTFDVVTALDVLEHINDDTQALKEWIRVLKPGGSLLLTVPAYQWLWSQHDEINNHYRRYLRKQLRKQLDKAGFKVIKASYAIVFSLPLVVASRLLARLSHKNPDNYSSFVKLPRVINTFFINLLKVEALAQKSFSFPVGTSLLMVGKK
jgi:ubiquinone/menaquinone biosynthesis C-methylase UbiE